MGKKAKGSRKGKKAWRANISTDDIDDYFIETTKDANTGGSLSSIPDHSLFYLDKADDAPPPPPKSKTDRHREKLLHVDRVLQRNPFVQPIPSSKSCLKKRKRNAALAATRIPDKDEKYVADLGQLRDLWDEEGAGIGIKKPVAAHIPAVEVEPLGCSFNPPFEAHQDSLAEAVAYEMQKSYRKELEPQPIPSVFCEEIDEEEKFFLEAGNGEEEEEAVEDTNEESLIERPLKRKRVTRVELNRRSRRKERIKAEAESQKVEKLLREIDSLPDILDEISKEDEAKQRKQVRRVVAKQERMKSGPPRLGKHKFEPAPPQVLLSEEISGSLRKLKSCCTLASHRFKSLEKRGLIVPGSKRSRN